MDHGGYSNKLRGKHKVSTYKFPWKTDKLGVDKRKFSSCVRGHPWALEKTFVSRTVHQWELLPWADNRRKIEWYLMGESYVLLCFTSKEWTAFFPADKRRFDTTNPICSVSQRSYSCMGSLLMSEGKQS